MTGLTTMAPESVAYEWYTLKSTFGGYSRLETIASTLASVFYKFIGRRKRTNKQRNSVGIRCCIDMSTTRIDTMSLYPLLALFFVALTVTSDKTSPVTRTHVRQRQKFPSFT